MTDAVYTVRDGERAPRTVDASLLSMGQEWESCPNPVWPGTWIPGTEAISFSSNLLMRCTPALRDVISRLWSIPNFLDGVISSSFSLKRVFLDGAVGIAMIFRCCLSFGLLLLRLARQLNAQRFLWGQVNAGSSEGRSIKIRKGMSQQTFTQSVLQCRSTFFLEGQLKGQTIISLVRSEQRRISRDVYSSRTEDRLMDSSWVPPGVLLRTLTLTGNPASVVNSPVVMGRGSTFEEISHIIRINGFSFWTVWYSF